MTVDIDLHPSTIPWFAAGLELGYPTADANGLQRESEFLKLKFKNLKKLATSIQNYNIFSRKVSTL